MRSKSDLRSARPIEPPDILELAPGEHAHSSRHLTYVRIASGTGWLLDAYPCDAATGIIPVGGELRCVRRMRCGSNPSTVPTWRRGGRWRVNVAHAAFWKHWEALSAAEDRRRETMRAATRGFDERALRGGLEEATNLFERNRLSTEPGDDPIVAAARIVAQADKIKIVAPRESHSESQAAVQAIAIESRLSIRRVRLRSGWHKRELGPLLAFRGRKREPVALLSHRGRARYVLIDPARPSERVRVDDAIASEIDSSAYVFLRPLPERPIGVWDLLRFGLRHSGVDAAQILALGFAGGDSRRHGAAGDGGPLRDHHSRAR